MSSSRSFISSHKTEVSSMLDSDDTGTLSARPDVGRQCPIHKKPHPLKHCRGFRTKTIEEWKVYLEEAGICFRCCSSSKHYAKDCIIAVRCKECSSDTHVVALHPGLAPWFNQTPESENGGEEKGDQSATVYLKCTEDCGQGNNSKMCLITVHPKGQLDMSMKLYTILNDQSSK